VERAVTLRLKVLIGVALAVFAACHVAAAYRLESNAATQEPDIISLLRD
jgi:hypothetical protein